MNLTLCIIRNTAVHETRVLSVLFRLVYQTKLLAQVRIRHDTRIGLRNTNHRRNQIRSHCTFRCVDELVDIDPPGRRLGWPDRCVLRMPNEFAIRPPQGRLFS